MPSSLRRILVLIGLLALVSFPGAAFASGPRACDLDDTCDPYQPDPTIVTEPSPVPVATTEPTPLPVGGGTVLPTTEPTATPVGDEVGSTQPATETSDSVPASQGADMTPVATAVPTPATDHHNNSPLTAAWPTVPVLLGGAWRLLRIFA